MIETNNFYYKVCHLCSTLLFAIFIQNLKASGRSGDYPDVMHDLSTTVPLGFALINFTVTPSIRIKNGIEMILKGCPHWEVTWFYESSCQIRRTDSSCVNICDSYVYFLLDVYTVLSQEIYA